VVAAEVLTRRVFAKTRRVFPFCPFEIANIPQFNILYAVILQSPKEGFVLMNQRKFAVRNFKKGANFHGSPLLIQ